MTVSLEEQRLGELPWIVVRGPAPEAFAALGRHVRAEIRAVLSDPGMLAPLRRHASGPPGSERLAAVQRASAAEFPEVWAELAALASGAEVPVGDLALLNFRGDLGVIGEDGTDHAAGCSDLAWRRHRCFIAHNEDDADFFDGRCVMLTLVLDGRQPVTAFWKPGFLPSTTFTVTGTGLVWGIDHMPVGSPGAHAGRHFVARALQREADTVDQAVEYLRLHPSAGGYAYVIGDLAGRVVSVESAAGRHASREVADDSALAWHTNHGRYVAGADADRRGTSELRGRVLQALHIPAGEPDAGWFARVLAGATPPDGVRSDPTPASPAMTLCTLIADLTAGELVMLGRGGQAVAIPLADLALGRPASQRAVPLTSLPVLDRNEAAGTASMPVF